MVKTITIMNDAYNTLKRAKGKDESFSDVIRKLASKQSTDLSKWFGILGGGEKRAKEFNEYIKKTRERLTKEAEERMKRLYGYANTR